MAQTRLLSDGLQQTLADLSGTHARIRAAISYVTAHNLDFRSGDLLICDASEAAIRRSGKTSASTLRRFFRQGAELFSYEGLHSKVAVIDDLALIGSANLSENAGINTCEASLLTNDVQVSALIQGFIDRLKGDSVPLSEDRLAHLEAIPVVREVPPERQSKKQIEVGTARLWLVATRELSERLAAAEQAVDERGMKDARGITKDKKGYELRSIRWSGRSKFRSQAKPGDLLIEMQTQKRGKRKAVTVHPVPIVHRLDAEKWTRFYLEVPVEAEGYDWQDVLADFASLGVQNLSPNLTRELSGRAANIVYLLE